MLCYISFQLYKVIALKRSINGLISVIIFKRTMTNISFNITYLQDNYLGTYMSMNKFMTDTQMAAVLTYLCTLCFLLRASDWFSNVQRRKCRTLPFTRNCPVTSAPWVWTYTARLDAFVAQQCDKQQNLAQLYCKKIKVTLHHIRCQMNCHWFYVKLCSIRC